MKQLDKELYNEAISRLWDFRIKRSIDPCNGNKVERILVQDTNGCWKVRLIKTIQEVAPTTENGIPKPTKKLVFYYSLLKGNKHVR